MADQERGESVGSASRDGPRQHEGDWRLAREALAGSPEARRRFTELMRCVPKFIALIHARRARSIPDHELEDLVQETLTQLWRRLDSYEGQASLQTWAYRFCQLTLSTHRRTHERRASRMQAAPLDSPERAAGRDYGWVHEALEKLREPDARILRHRHFDRLSFAEIAARLALPESSVKASYKRGLERLRELLGRRVSEDGL